MHETGSVLSGNTRKRIARAYWPDRWNYYYTRGKLAGDPMYGAVTRALAGSRAPVLDLGCGIGLLAHVLAAGGLTIACTGIDSDAAKIAQAQAAAHRAGLDRTRFICADLSDDCTIRDLGHRGSVVMLDLLQFVPPHAQQPILEQAAAAVSPSGRLVIRTGLANGRWRASITRTVDHLSRAVRWMNTGPKRYPERDFLQSVLAGAGLTCRFTPMWGKTPFNNWLVRAEHPAARSGNAAGPKPPAAA